MAFGNLCILKQKRSPALGMPPARIVLLTQTCERKQAEAVGLLCKAIGANPRNRTEKDSEKVPSLYHAFAFWYHVIFAWENGPTT